MNMKKTLAGVAVAAALGAGATVANAVAITSMTLGDYDGDGLQSDFNFYTPPTGNSLNKFGATGEQCGGSGCAPVAFGGATQGNGVFTTGFNFGGTGVFTPNTFGAGMVGDIGATTATFTAFDFGGEFGGVQFNLPPDGGPGNVVVADFTDLSSTLGAGNYGLTLTWVGTVVGGAFNGYPANWRLEGCASTTGTACVIPSTVIPVPAAVWLFGSGILGLVGVARRKMRA